MLQATLRSLLVSKSLQAGGFEWSLKNVSWNTLPTPALAGGGGGGEKEDEDGAEPNAALAGRYRL